MPDLPFLTVGRCKQITDTLIECAHSDAQQDEEYLYYIVSEWAKRLSIEEQLYAISSEQDIVVDLLGFDPWKQPTHY
jgi:hypothetical protein